MTTASSFDVRCKIDATNEQKAWKLTTLYKEHVHLGFLQLIPTS